MCFFLFNRVFDVFFFFFEGYNIIIFINGVPTEVPKGPVDMKAMFGQETVLVHSSGLPVLTNEFGISLHSLQHGESYFLVITPQFHRFVR